MATIKKAQFGRSMVVRNKPCRPGECGPSVDKRATRQLRREARIADRRARKMKDGGKSFPDLSKDGRITKEDILIGRGVLPKKAKKGISAKKAQTGTATPKISLRASQLKRLGRLSAKNPDKAEKVGSKMVERTTRRQRGKEYIQKNISTLMPQSKNGSKMKKARNGMKKCRGGCY